MDNGLFIAIAAFVMLFVVSCTKRSPYQEEIPLHFPVIKYPKDNLPTKERITLGKQLFFETALSADSTLSCASCHKVEFALADNVSISPGVAGRLGKRNAPSLFNVGYLKLINKDGGVTKLGLQAMVPLEDENEMGIRIQDAVQRLNENSNYVDLSKQAYGRDPDAFVITRALAAYVRTLISGDSPYDSFIQGDTSALNKSEQNGMALFFSDRLKCGNCHSGFNLTDNTFQNNGLYNEYEDRGRALVTLQDNDIGKFRVPSLRNVGFTAPYMHDGSIASLEDVLDHYSSGGKGHVNQNADIQGFEITIEEREDLLLFLQTFSGE